MHSSRLSLQLTLLSLQQVYTSKTVHGSYCRKLKAITGRDDISSFYFARHVPLGVPYRILGATFEFDYSYHSIPTVRYVNRFINLSLRWLFYLQQSVCRCLSHTYKTCASRYSPKTLSRLSLYIPIHPSIDQSTF